MLKELLAQPVCKKRKYVKTSQAIFFCISNDQNLSLGLYMELELKLSSCYEGEYV